jgi:hypothetical protein
VGANQGENRKCTTSLALCRCFMFRPGVIQPLYGARSKTASYRVLYTFARSFLSLLHRVFPNHVLTTEEIGRAMLTVARRGYSKPILEARDIRAVLKDWVS